jgi:hypothetical protein
MGDKLGLHTNEQKVYLGRHTIVSTAFHLQEGCSLMYGVPVVGLARSVLSRGEVNICLSI